MIFVSQSFAMPNPPDTDLEELGFQSGNFYVYPGETIEWLHGDALSDNQIEDCE